MEREEFEGVLKVQKIGHRLAALQTGNGFSFSLEFKASALNSAHTHTLCGRHSAAYIALMHNTAIHFLECRQLKLEALTLIAPPFSGSLSAV